MCAFLLRQNICVCLNSHTLITICESPVYVCSANPAAGCLCAMCFLDVTCEPCTVQRHEPEDGAGGRPGQPLRGSLLSEQSAEAAHARETL